ncbi:putative uncharacterized protein DDB_G0282133 [Halyomorpha halys]|uniref:putative uncharacterized protein DDB_G0282133 n=1 Tax=Halyomorpha halys TaxID=286706 RepID=UPI0006D4CCAC|nr:putative uncharacterized protein DDB_G0282133 [Halyomorpha halys]
MAEIRANREYKFKEFSISEEIPKSPPIKTKRWTYRDTNPNSGIYSRPIQRKWNSKDSANSNWSGDNHQHTNSPQTSHIIQQYVKPTKKPESDLRAEFFNAYKKYYRRVDIKRVEVQSTLNVDAKFQGPDESVEGESSLYKEKECMEINIVMDTEKNDALVSGKVRRTVLSVEEGTRGKESIRSDKMIIGAPKELGISEQNMVRRENMLDESGYYSSQDKSNCFQENHQEMKPKLNRNFVPFAEVAQNNINIGSKSGKTLLQSSDKVSLFNDERYAPYSNNDIVKKTDLFIGNTDSGACCSLTQVAAGNDQTVIGVDGLLEDDEKIEYVGTVERTPYYPERKPNVEDYDYPTPSSGNAAKSIYVDSSSNNVNHHGQKSKFDEIPAAREPPSRHDPNHSNSDSSDVEDVITGSIKEPGENPKNSVSNFRTKSVEEPPSTKSLEETQNHLALTTEDKVTKSESGIRFRGLRGGPFKESNKKVLRSLVVNLEKSDPNNDGNIVKREYNSFPQKEQTNLTQRSESKGVSNLKRRDVFRNAQKSYIADNNPEFLTSPQFKFFDRTNSNNEEPEKFQNTDSKNQFSEHRSFKSVERENVAGPSVICDDKKNTTEDPAELLQTNKLIESSEDSDLSDYDSYSSLQSFSNWNSNRKISGGSKDQPEFSKRDYQIHCRSSEKRMEKTRLKELSKTPNDTVGKENENEGAGMRLPHRRYSNITSFQSKNILPKHHSSDKGSRGWDSHCAKQERKLEICNEKVDVSVDEKEDWMNERNGVVSKNHDTKESFEKRGMQQISRRNMPNSSAIGNHQFTEQQAVTRAYKTKQFLGGPNRVAVDNEENKEFSKKAPDKCNISEQSKIIFNGCDKKLSKSSNSESLQIGPTCAVQYVPHDQQNNYDETWEKKEMDGRCHRGSTLAFHCNHQNVTDFICKKRNETHSRHCCNNSPSLFHDNCLNKCRHEMICNGHYEPSSSNNSCGYHYAANNNCDCENFNNGCYRSMRKNNNIYPCHVRDSNLSCLSRNNYNCPMSNRHRRRNGCSCQEGNRDYCQEGNRDYCQEGNRNYCQEGNRNHCQEGNRNHCQEGNRNHCLEENRNHCQEGNRNHCLEGNSNHCQEGNRNHCLEGNRNHCQECGEEQMRLLLKECSGNFQKSNQLLCCCHRCSTEKRLSDACTEIGKCSGRGCSGEGRINPSPFEFDRKGQWITTGHQPGRNANKCPVEANIERNVESSAKPIARNNDIKESLVKDLGIPSPVYSSNNGNRYTQECSSSDIPNRNNPYIYENEGKNVYRAESTEKESIRSHFLRDQGPTGRKYYYSPVDSGEVDFNFTDWVDPSAIQDEMKEPAAKTIPGENLCSVEEAKRISGEGEVFSTRDSFNTCDRNIEGTNAPIEGSDHPISDPLFLCEEQWDIDEEGSSDFEPIYLREEHWEPGDEETGVNQYFPRDSRSTSVRLPNGISCLWKGCRSGDSQPVGRSRNFSEEESRIWSNVHAVSDPSFHCEQQWGSDEEKCKDHKFQSTLPKNRTKKKNGRDRRSFNPRRWDMVTDLPKNEYFITQNRNNNGQNNYELVNLRDNMVFRNRIYYSNN